MSATAVAEPKAAESKTGFDFPSRVCELHTHSTEALRARMAAARREQLRWRLEELACLRVLDARDALGAVPDRTESARTRKAKLEVARALESRPALARAAHEGRLSWDQLVPVCELSTPEADRDWATRAPHVSPVELERRRRRSRRATFDDDRRKYAARELVTWVDPVDGMHCGRWCLPPVEGGLVAKVLDWMAERRRPAKGEKWDSLAHRKADALVDLATNYADVERTGRFRYEIVNITMPGADPRTEADGLPIAPETLASLWPEARIRDTVTDPTGLARTVKPPRKALPADVERHIRRRDKTCRVPGCENSRGLQIHHIDPVCFFGDTHLVHKLACVCPAHHKLLDPHGPYRLVGDAEDPEGLELVLRGGGPSP